MILGTEIARYSVFLLVYISWILLYGYLSDRFAIYFLKGRYFLESEMQILSTAISLFFFVWLLTGYFDTRTFFIFVVASQVGIILGGILWGIVGTPHSPYNIRIILRVYELVGSNKHGLVGLILSVGLALFIAYPVIVGVVYTQYPIPSKDANILVLQVTVIMLFVRGGFLSLPWNLSVLLSKDLDYDIRTYHFVRLMSNIFIYALLLSLFLQSLGASSLTYNFFGVNFSPLLLMLLCTYYLTFVVVPYLIGIQRAKKWRQKLFKRRLFWLDKIIETLEFPRIQSQPAMLKQVYKQVTTEKKSIKEPGNIAKILKQKNDINENEYRILATLALAEKRLRHSNPIADYVDFLESVKKEIEGILSVYDAPFRKPTSVKDVGVYVDNYRRRKAALIQKIESEEKTKPLVWVGISLLISPIFNEVFTSLGEWIWNSISASITP